MGKEGEISINALVSKAPKYEEVSNFKVNLVYKELQLNCQEPLFCQLKFEEEPNQDELRKIEIIKEFVGKTEKTDLYFLISLRKHKGDHQAVMNEYFK